MGFRLTPVIFEQISAILFIDTNSRLITTRPEFYIALATMILGAQFFIAGFLAELILKFNLNKDKYSIKNKTF